MRRFSTILNKNVRISAITILFTIILFILSIAQFIPPRPLPENASKNGFSAHRAWKHLEVIAREPHPTGSKRQGEVHNYIIETLASFGLTAETQSNPKYELNNILARISGENPDGAVLLMAHYDSVEVAPGATDNGSSVAALLEVTRGLLEENPYKNDIIIIFTDAEEKGLIGAHCFISDHPWFTDVSIAINLEMAKKTFAGIIRSSPDNGWLIKQYAISAPHPFGASSFDRIYSMLRYGDDLQQFIWKGIPGLTFASIYVFPEYHTKHDSIKNADIRSIQHHGEQTLAFTKHLANQELKKIKTQNRVYFNIWGPLFIHYSLSRALPIAAVVTVLLFGLFIYGHSTQRLNFKHIGIVFLIFVICLLLMLFFTLKLLSPMISIIPDNFFARISPHFENDHLFIFIFVFLTVSITLSLFAWISKKTAYENMIAGAAVLWFALLWISSIFLPDFSYVFSWPLLFFLIFIFSEWLLIDKMSQRKKRIIVSLILRLLSIVPAFLLIVPSLYLLYLGTGLDFIHATSASIFLLALFYLPVLKEMLNRKPGKILYYGISLTIFYFAGNMIYYYYFA
jgi:hypothetical protein